MHSIINSIAFYRFITSLHIVILSHNFLHAYIYYYSTGKSNIVQADIMVVDSFEKIGKEWIYVRNQPVMGKPKDTFTFTSTFKIYKETFWPSKVYSLTLKQFLDKWCASHTQKTLKLDFTSAIALTSSLKIMIDTFKVSIYFLQINQYNNIINIPLY